MVDRIKHRFILLTLGVLAVAGLLSVAGSVVDAAIGRGQVQALASRILGGPDNNWTPQRPESGREALQERLRELRELRTDGRYIHTATHVFDPLKDPVLPAVAAFKPMPAFPSKLGGNYYIVQLEGNFWDAAYEQRITATGAKVMSTVPVNAAIVRASQLQIEQIARFPETRWVGPDHPFYRVDRSALALVAGEGEADFLDELGRVTLLVGFYPGERASDYAAEVRSTPGVDDVNVRDEQPWGSRITLDVDARVLPDALQALSRLGGVASVSAVPRMKLMNATNAWAHQTYVNSGDLDIDDKVHANGVVGAGQIVSLVDSGLENDMCYFRYGTDISDVTYYQLLDPGDVVPPQPFANVTNPCNKVIAYYLNNGSAKYDDRPFPNPQHGTHVAGTILGDNFRTDTGGNGLAAFCALASSGEPIVVDTGAPPSVHRGGDAGRYDGMAPGAQLVVQDRGTGSPNFGINVEPDYVDELVQAWDSGARYMNQSFGVANRPDYQGGASGPSTRLDDFLFARRTMNSVWAAGNSGNQGTGTLSGFGAAAMNTITVGWASDGAAGVGMDLYLDANNGSSRGPTTDGRLKPELAARGDNISATSLSPEPADQDAGGNPAGDGDCSTVGGGGTSFAAPVITGLAALVGQYFEDGYYPTGEATRARWAVPGVKLDPLATNGDRLQLDTDVNPNADECLTDESLCDPGTSFRPTNALVRAILVNSAMNMTGDNTGNDPGTADSRPNYAQGWGIPVLDHALYFQGDVGGDATGLGDRSGLLVLTDTPNGVDGTLEMTDVRQDVVYKFEPAFTNLRPTEIKEWDVTILPGEPLIVTLAWSDPGQGSTTAAPLVNDLDLEVIGPDPENPSQQIVWRPNPDVAYTGPAPGFVRDGWVQTQTIKDSGEAFIWVGKGGTIPPKDQWPDPASADRFNNLEQIAMRTDDVVGGTYKIRVLNWDIRGQAARFTDGLPDFEVDDNFPTGASTDDVELNQQGFALVLTGNFATTQGVLSFNQAGFTCADDQRGRITLRDVNGCATVLAGGTLSVDVTTTTPSPSFPADFETFELVPDFPCDPGLPADDERQPKVFRTGTFPVVNSGDPAEVVQGDGQVTLQPGFEMRATYLDADPAGSVSTAKASLTCKASFSDGGFLIDDGCDLSQPGVPEGPDNPKQPDQFLDAGELVEYTVFFNNTGSDDFNDVHATLSLLNPSNPPELQVLNNPVRVGKVPSGRRASATFLVQVGDLAPAGSVTPQKRVDLQIGLTSPADDLIEPITFVQNQKLESDVQTYTYNTRDPSGTLFGPNPGQIQELKPGRDPSEGPDAFITYDNMLVDPGPDGNYDGVNDVPSLNAVNLAPENADDPWDFDDDPDGWTTHEGTGDVPTQWTWDGNEAGDFSSSGGCGWSTTYEDPTGEQGNGIWHTGTVGPGGTPLADPIGGVHPETLNIGPANLGPDPMAGKNIFTAINNQSPAVCATYAKQSASQRDFWYLQAPRIYKVTRSTEFQVAWQRWTIYTRIFGHEINGSVNTPQSNFAAFVALANNRPIPGDYTINEPDYFNAIYSTTPAGPDPETPIAADWTDPLDNTFTYNLAHPSGSFPDLSYEEVFGPPSPDGWEHSLAWWIEHPSNTPVPDRYGWGVDDSSFIWTESRETDDQNDCSLAVQTARVFFNQQRYSLCEGEMEISVIDPNNAGLGYVYVRVTSAEEPIPGEILKLRQNASNNSRYDGRIRFTVDPRKNIRGVLLVTAGQVDVGQGADTVNVQYDPREPQDPTNNGVADFRDDGWLQGTCTEGPDGKNDDYLNNCTGMPTPDDNGDGCPDGDGIADAEDDCDVYGGIDDPACDPIKNSCPPGGYEANDTAFVNCPGGGVFYIKHTLTPVTPTTGDDDNFADRNEELYMSVDLLNMRADDLENSTVRITTPDDDICILQDESFYGNIPGVTTARLLGLEVDDQIQSTPAINPVTGQTNYFRIGVPPETITSSLDAIQKATVRVDIYADNFSTAGTTFSAFYPLSFTLPLDLDPSPNGTGPDFFETFCNAAPIDCYNPPGKAGQPWYTQPGFAADPDSGIAYVDSRKVYPDNGGFCPECPFDSTSGCSTTNFDPPQTEPPCKYQFDGQGPLNPEYIDNWHIMTLGQGPIGITRTGDNALFWGDEATFSYASGQLSALVLPPVVLSSDPSVTPELRFSQIAEFWLPFFTSGLVTPIGSSQVQINADYRPGDPANSFPETSWQRLDPKEGIYNTVTDTLNACRGAFCGVHQPTFQARGDFDAVGQDANGAGGVGSFDESVVDLSDWRGQKVRIRFLVSVLQDINVSPGGGRGWLLDDISISGLATGGADPATPAGIVPEADPLPGPGPCGLQAEFTATPVASCLSSPVQFDDRHIGLGESDGSGGRLPIAYEWDFDGDGTPEISCADACLEGEDIAGRADLSSPDVNAVEGNCDAPMVTYATARNYVATMSLCQGGTIQASGTQAVRIRPDLSASNVSASSTPVIAKGDPGCPAAVPVDLNGDSNIDAADQQIWDDQYIGCVYQGTRVSSKALVSGSARNLTFCWSNESEVLCGERSGKNYHRYENLGAFGDFVTIIDSDGGCSYSAPLGVYVIPGPAFQVGTITLMDDQCGQATIGNVDPGEFVRIIVPIDNTGAGPISELVGELRSPDPRITVYKAASRVVGPSDPYLLNPGETGAAVFEFLMSDADPVAFCRGVLDFNLSLYNWDRTFDAALNFTLPVGDSQPASGTCSATAPPIGEVSGNQFVCDPGNGNDSSTCPSPGAISQTCCPSRQSFPAATCDNPQVQSGTITDLCVNATINMNGIGNEADELNVTLLGPSGQSFPLLLGNLAGSGCKSVTIDLCTSDNLGTEGTRFGGGVCTAVVPDRDQSFYSDFRSAFRNTDAGAGWKLRVEDARPTTQDYSPSMYSQVDEFSVDLSVNTQPVCQPVALQDSCLVDNNGPIFGGPFKANGCSTVSVNWLPALDQEDLNGDQRGDQTPMSYEVFRVTKASCADIPTLAEMSNPANSLGTIMNASVFRDTSSDTSVGAYWYRVVATDGSGNPSTQPTIPNPDDPAHWACTEIAAFCPPPIAIGPIRRVGTGSGFGIEAPLAEDPSALGVDGVRLYRGDLPCGAPGAVLDRLRQDHKVLEGVQGRCYEPPTVMSIQDDDQDAGNYGTGCFYYLATTLRNGGVGQPFIEGTLDTAGFGTNAQAVSRVHIGDADNSDGRVDVDCP